MADKKRILKGIAAVAGTVAALLLLIAITLQLLLTPKSLNNMLTTLGNEYLNATIKMDTIELHLFKHFPYITLSVKDGEVISHALDSARSKAPLNIPLRADSLLKFKRLNIAVSPAQLLFKKLNIRRISITSPQVYVYVLPDKTSNYNILKAGALPAQSEDTIASETSSVGSKMVIDAKRISIREGATILYNSGADSTFAKITLKRLLLRGNFSTDLKQMHFTKAYISHLNTDISRLSVQNNSTSSTAAGFAIDSLNITNRSNGEFTIAAFTRSKLKINRAVLAENFPFEIEGAIKFDTTQALKGELRDLKVTIAKIPIVFNGNFNITPNTLYTNNICGRVENFRISEIFQYIPQHIFKGKNAIKSNASISIDVNVNGSYNFKTGELPSVMATLDIPKSYVEFEGRASRINELETHIKAYYSATNRDSAAIEIDKLVVNGRGVHIALNGKILELASVDPYIDADFKSSLFLDTLSNLFPAKSGTYMSGSIKAELAVKSNASNLNLYNIGNSGIRGTLTTDSTKIVVPNEDFFAHLKGIKLVTAATSNTKDSTISIGTKMLGSNFTADSIYFRYKEQVKIATSRFRLAGHQAANVLNKDTATRRVYPFNGEISAQSLYLKGLDSTALRMRMPKIRFSIMPANKENTIPMLKASTDVQRFIARDAINRVSFSNGNISINAMLKRSDNRKRGPRAVHGKVYDQPVDDFKENNIDFRANSTLRDFIRNWGLSGNITAKRGAITTPFFPLRTKMENINFGFTNNEVEFNNTKIKVGQSQFTLTGKASGLRRAMLVNGAVRLEGSIISDTLNFNELVAAANKGAEFTKAEDTYIDSLAAIADEDELVQTIAATAQDSTISSELIIVPGNVDIKLNLNVKHGVYSNIELQKVTAEMLVKERCLQINGFEAITNAGNLSLSAFYATKSKTDLSTGFDLELKDMAIEKLVNLMPRVDSLLPMLKSFEGKVNCNITATSKLDTAMNFVLPTMRGVARITGENVVLMDGETFAAIAKKLKFKNREKNYINRISVELLLNDNKIEVFPFIAEMDRYKFAISGTQNLDMSFLYNISVLQSPLPFRIGVKILGNTDDFDFKIGRAQYKSDKLPVFTKVIDSARVNLRDQIANIYRIGIDAALKNSGNLDRVQRRKDEYDSQYVEKMDTLSKQEQIELEMIEPQPVPKPEPISKSEPAHEPASEAIVDTVP